MAFHSYAQVIRKLFNAYRFGPPDSVTCPSSCSCVDHSVSRLPPTTIRPLRTRFRSGSGPSDLSLAADDNSQVHYAKGTPSPHLVAPTACRRMVSGSFHSLAQGSFHLSLTVLCAIGLSVVFSLSGWSPIIRPEFLVFRLTQVALLPLSASDTGLSPAVARHSSRFSSLTTVP